ncbi:polynucleotide kinase 3 phosphatase-domain-containing protein [Halteromyces radiatus]|uniref:polynucleotide kinase 3 phosphatase-domain-containing protein n=1 Tax=Halteromyces radiatus TaxID=101107 RepID=UPI00222018CC|nr:polynucleotide kinase 3 phosphatase-domain-containing protein [Halteromyces radiatus]KAI8092988.1 polynucleotide kinase 3 phosphatase-domain-containing protein [Halteromyces radiatus]
MKIKWHSRLPSVLICVSKGLDRAKAKVAAFDLDSTLITTKSGKTFASNSDDWKWWHTNIPERLMDLYSQGYKIVIFSNQNGLNSEKRIRDFKIKLDTILGQLSMPVLLYAAMKKDQYRKPMTGMWEDMIKEYKDDDVTIDLKQSFYVGDAAGRLDGWKHKMKRDHSCADRKFAHNIGIKFYTPEVFFHNEKEVDFSWGDFNPHSYSMAIPLFTPTCSPLIPQSHDDSKEMIIFVGSPASGKSSFAKKHLIPHGYEYINQDTLKTKAKCLKACEEAIQQNKSVVIDNTNGTSDVRAEYLNLARKHDLPARCFYFVADEHLCRHNNYYRHIRQKESRDLLSEIVFRTYKSRFQEPTLDEGFAEIKKINFVFEGDDDDLMAWRKWYL